MKAAEFVASLTEIVESAAKQRSAALGRLEEDFLKLSLHIAEKIIKREVESVPRVLLPSIKAGLERLGSCEQVIIRVSPKNYQALKDASSFADVFNGRILWERILPYATGIACWKRSTVRSTPDLSSASPN